jgi:hypothetical protein
MTFLSHLLRDAGLWDSIQPRYRPLKPKPRKRPILSEEEELRLFQTAKDNPRWRVAYLASLVVAATTLRPNQVRQLRLGEVDLPNSRLLVRINNGPTPIPLNDAAAWAVRELLNRAEQRGAQLPEHYLIPHRAKKNGGQPTVTKPQSGWRRAWRRMCEAADLPELQPFDLTHSSIARILHERGLAQTAPTKMAASVKQDIALKSLNPEIADGIHSRNRSKSASIVMVCSRCQRSGRTGDRFCGQCGAALRLRLKCGYCGAIAKTAAGFCPGCSKWLSPETVQKNAITLTNAKPKGRSTRNAT